MGMYTNKAAVVCFGAISRYVSPDICKMIRYGWREPEMPRQPEDFRTRAVQHIPVPFS